MLQGSDEQQRLGVQVGLLLSMQLDTLVVEGSGDRALLPSRDLDSPPVRFVTPVLDEVQERRPLTSRAPFPHASSTVALAADG